MIIHTSPALHRGLTESPDQIAQGNAVLLTLRRPQWETLAKVFRAEHEFFKESLKNKCGCALPGECGYRSLGIEYSETPERPDQVESFTVAARLAEHGTTLPLESGRQLHVTMLSAVNVLEPLAEILIRRLAKHLGTVRPPQKGLHYWSRLQLNYSTPATALGNIHDAHEDGDLITLARATAPGLEIRGPDGSFVAAETELPNVLIMPGEICYLLSGGTFSPLWHRVRAVPQHPERLVLVFFADLDPGACRPWLANHINDGIDIGERVRVSVKRFGLHGFGS